MEGANEYEQRLQDYLLQGLAADITRADQSRALAQAIGEHAAGLNAGGYGELGGTLQAVLSEYQTLAITKLFEATNPRYQLRSIPATLDFIEKHREKWTLPQRHVIESVLTPVHGPAVGEMKTHELVRRFVEFSRASLPSATKAAECGNSDALRRLRASRDKAIAHNEALSTEDRQRATWGEAEALVDYAKRFLGVVGYGFTSTLFTLDDGEYLLSHDARRVSIALHRLFRSAGISPDVRGETGAG